MKRRIFILILLFLQFSCSQGNKHGNIPERTLVKILTDIHIADAVTFSMTYRQVVRNRDSAFYYESILKKYGVTHAEFDSTISWYSGNPELYDKLYEKVLARLNLITAGLNEKAHADSIQSQKGNLWNRKRDWILPDDGARENISFSISVNRKGQYILSARIRINPPDMADNPQMIVYSTHHHMLPGSNADSASIVKLEKTGLLKLYTVTVSLDKDTAALIKGFILGHDPKPGNWFKSVEVRDIRLTFKPDSVK
jgi:hypothetical protein